MLDCDSNACLSLQYHSRSEFYAQITPSEASQKPVRHPIAARWQRPAQRRSKPQRSEVTAPMRRSEEYRLRSMLTSNKVRFGSTRDCAYSLLIEERAIQLHDTHIQTSVNTTETYSVHMNSARRTTSELTRMRSIGSIVSRASGGILQVAERSLDVQMQR